MYPHKGGLKYLRYFLVIRIELMAKLVYTESLHIARRFIRNASS